ncbi:lipid-A-disaccharide synthase [Agrobacterium vitis]|uniref:Lipid-A-disaccharide synthase n=1 Tax=Agrobacterium vitis TaxID=373 RepID=A0ABD6G6F5_AGRVI|nr:lipid-A-disaccharide synthase [Agrobacterium vitis]MUO77737.1 lipid-A-disaccharide synthase [Agrobacterium vitis]MUO93254.1 lipid-A-disaccharide synthase [Agrobacterium vitis]MUP04605.1 lipid-A-disaccharide synthase [Agrobacterium vitis]MUZ80958.1 lipid-A-disaccharide synthase [Agrobacterium vitis]MVA08857.1 lipid-A-disaccharide synthase [Agrobacterium vitis]
MENRPLKIAVIAGEVSGDLLGADLIAALKQRHDGEITLIGVGGPALEAQGLTSLFDFSELSVMGITQVLAKLPRFLTLIGTTAKAIVSAKPDLLLIVDSPDFTHRVAKKVRAACPTMPVVNYVCPSVWAWKEYRAKAMLAYVDSVLAVLPFEPAVMQRLGGPETHFVGHRLVTSPAMLACRADRMLRPLPVAEEPKTIMLLPGSRGAEISALSPVFRDAARIFVERNGPTRFVLPTVPRRERQVREAVANWEEKPDVVIGEDAKWRAFAEADAAIAASGTVLLELCLAGVPVVSTYKTDWLIKLLHSRIKTWTGALPSIIADYVVVPEYLNEQLRGASLARWMERLSTDTRERQAMVEGFDLVWQKMQTEIPAGEAGAKIVLDVLKTRAII